MASELSVNAWTSFLAKQKVALDDKALVKALAAFDKTDEARPEARSKALEELIKQIPEQVKVLTKARKELGDKPFRAVKDQLYALLDEAEALLKKTQAAMAAGDDDEEADTPVLLTTKMVPLLRELRKGEVRMHALICTAGKNTAVLIMRRAISPSRRKVLAEAVDAKGGAKYIAGECVFENKALTFIVKSPAAQLAKRVRQALLDQTEMRLKVKVRGEDGDDEDGEDGEDESDGWMASWKAARERVVAQITAVARNVAATGDPDARGVIIELQSIVKNLTAEPRTPQSVAELLRYLDTDDVIVAAEEVPPRFGVLEIREPLVKLLQSARTGR